MLKSHFTDLVAAFPEQRLLAVDVFRGMAITAMVLVNNPGSWQYVFSPLQHAKWHGWTPTDLIFPCFLFIMGVSIILSLTKHAKPASILGPISAYLGKHKKRQILAHALIRSISLFALGLLLAVLYYNFSDPNYSWWQVQVKEIRWMGVLQRLGMVYLLCVVLAIYCSRATILLSSIAVLILYTLALLWLPYSHNEQVFQGGLLWGNNLAAYVDHHVLTPTHVLYADARPFAFDPEGLLSTLPATVSAISGMLAGYWLTVTTNQKSKASGLMLVGGVLFILGLWLDLYHPINKALWTSSYVLLSSGFAAILLGLLLWVLDVQCWRAWCGPLLVFGVNSIAFFMFSGILARLSLVLRVDSQSVKSWLYNEFYAPLFGPYWGSLSYAISVLLVSYCVFFYCYQRRWIWKV